MDTFTTFVDSLAESLDDHDARGDELAARAHLSRFHFDRVVSGISGETPAMPYILMSATSVTPIPPSVPRTLPAKYPITTATPILDSGASETRA